jgi:hypothetical protein
LRTRSVLDADRSRYRQLVLTLDRVKFGELRRVDLVLLGRGEGLVNRAS